MRLIDFNSIIQRARQRTNTVGSRNPPDSDIMGYVSDEFVQMYVRVMDASASDFWWSYYTFNTQQGVNLYPLPVDGDRIRRVDSQAQGTPASVQNWADVPRYDEALENTLGTPWGGSVMPSGITIRLAYAPDAPVPQQYATLVIPTADGLDSLTFTAAQAGLNGQAVKIAFQISGSGPGAPSVTVAGMVITVTANTGSTAQSLVTAFAGVNAARVLASCSCTQPNDTLPALSQAATALGGTLQWNMPEGFDRFLVAGAAALICSRLNRDGSAFQAERDRLEPLITIRADKRDENQPQVAKDVQRERARMASPFYVPATNRFGYRLYGTQIRLAPYVQGGW